LEQTADPGTIQVGESTLALTHVAFTAIDHGSIDVKGKSEPISTFRPIAFLGVAVDDGTRHAFVGREGEVAPLLELVDRLDTESGWVPRWGPKRWPPG
jgi:hypothetical protein